MATAQTQTPPQQTKAPIISAIQKPQADILQKIEAFQTVIVFAVLFFAYAVGGYFFYAEWAGLKNAPKSFTVPLPQEIKNFEASAGTISFDGLDSVPKYVQNLKDNSITIVGGSKGRDNPFDSYATPRSSR